MRKSKMRPAEFEIRLHSDGRLVRFWRTTDAGDQIWNWKAHADNIWHSNWLTTVLDFGRPVSLFIESTFRLHAVNCIWIRAPFDFRSNRSDFNVHSIFYSSSSSSFLGRCRFLSLCINFSLSFDWAGFVQSTISVSFTPNSVRIASYSSIWQSKSHSAWTKNRFICFDVVLVTFLHH